MSKPTWMALGIALLGSACATGTTNGGNGGPIDASVQPHDDDAAHATIDAPTPRMDASVVPDAFVPVDAPPDAPPDAASSLFCTDNSQCTNAGECCLTFGQPLGFCAPGTIVLGACVPIT